MPKLSDYNVDAQDISTFQTRETGGHSSPIDFDPMGADGAQKLSAGFDDIADTANRVQTKEDMAWAQQQFTGAQVHWYKNVANYTDPDAMTKDLEDYTKQAMEGAPTGRASDFLVRHMDTLAPRLVRRTLLNQAKAQVNATSQQVIDGRNSLAMLATGNPVPNGDGELPQQDGTPQLVTPSMSSVEIRGLYNQNDQIDTTAKGIVPSALNTQQHSATNAAISQGLVAARVAEVGPKQTADEIDSGKLVPEGKWTPANLQQMSNQLRVQHASNIGVADLNADKLLTNDQTAIDQGNFPDAVTAQAHADTYAMGKEGKKGLNYDKAQIEYLDKLNAAKQASDLGVDKFNAKKMMNADQIAAAQGTLDQDTFNSHMEQYAIAMGGKKQVDYAQAKVEYSTGIQDIQTSAGLGVDKFNAKKQLIQDQQDIYNGKEVDATGNANKYAEAMGGSKAQNFAASKAEYLDKVQSAQDAAIFRGSIMGASPQVAQSKLADFSDTHEEGSHAYAKASLVTNKLLTDLRESPGDYPLNSPQFYKSYSSAADQLAKAASDPNLKPQAIANFQNVLKSGVAMQVNTGEHTEDSAGVMPKSTAQGYVNQIRNASPQDAAKTLHDIQDTYGQYWPNAVRDMSRQGLDGKFLAVASFRGTPVETTMINALNMEHPAKGTPSLNIALGLDGDGGVGLSKISNATTTAMAPYIGSVSWNPKGVQHAAELSQLVTTMTKYHMVTGQMDSTSASKLAADEVINSQFDFGKVNGRNFLVTKQYVPDGDTDSVVKGAQGMLPYIASGQVANPDIGYAFGKRDADLTQEDKDHYQQSISRYGFWTPTEDGKGLRLMIDQQKRMLAQGNDYMADTHIANPTGTGVAPVMAKGGKPIEVPFSLFQIFHKADGWGWEPAQRAFESMKQAWQTNPVLAE